MDHPIFDQPPSVPDDLRAKARAAGWTDELLNHAYELRMSRSLLEFFMEDERVDPPVVEMVLRQRERLTQGTLRVREATWEDAEALVEFYANAPEEVGEWQVTVDRSPYPFAQFRLQEHPSLLILEDRGVILGSVAYSTRNTLVAGERISVNVASAFRIHREFRGAGYSRLISGAAEGPEWAWWAFGRYWYVRSGNFSAFDWLKNRMPDTVEDRRMSPDMPRGMPVTVHYLNTRDGDGSATDVRQARRSDLAACVELINRTHEGLDLFRPYSEEFLATRLDDSFWGPKPKFWTDVYTWDDFFVLEASGEIVACAGLWDRGHHLREVWHSAKSGERRVIDPAALMDFGYAEGYEDAMARLIETLLAKAGDKGREQMMAPIEYLPALVERVERHVSGTETRAFAWRMSEQAETLKKLVPQRLYTDLAYW